MNLAQYKINKTEYLEIRTDGLPLFQVYNCYELDIWFVGDTQKIRFGYEYASSFCYTIQQKVPRLLRSERIIDLTVSTDLGFLMNQDFQDLYHQEYGFFDYHFLGNSHKQERPYYSSWLYNDQDGKIIFEICPKYPWNDESKKDRKHPDFIAYDQFIKNYKPTLIRTIEPKYLKQWLKQVNVLELIFQENEEKDLEKDHEA